VSFEAEMKGTAVHCAVTEYESPCGVPSKHQQIPSLDAYGVEAVDLCGTGLHATYFPFASGITPSPTLVPIEQSPHDTINGLPVLAGMDALRKRLRSGVVEPEVDDEERPRAPRTCSSCKNRQPAKNFKGVHATCQPCLRRKKAKRDSKVMALKSLKRQQQVSAQARVYTPQPLYTHPPQAYPPPTAFGTNQIALQQGWHQIGMQDSQVAMPIPVSPAHMLTHRGLIMPVSKSTSRMVHVPIMPHQQMVDSRSGMIIDSRTGMVVDNLTGMVIDSRQLSGGTSFNGEERVDVAESLLALAAAAPVMMTRVPAFFHGQQPAFAHPHCCTLPGSTHVEHRSNNDLKTFAGERQY